MELSDKQRAQLAAIREDGIKLTFRRDKRRTPDDDYEKQKKILETLIQAWNAIDHDTQVEITYGIHRMWEDQRDDALFPDLLNVVSDLLLSMEMPPHGPERIDGLTLAAKSLWVIYCGGQFGQPVSIDRKAREEIGKEIASLFELSQSEAERLVGQSLKNLDAQDKLPRRKGFQSDPL